MKVLGLHHLSMTVADLDRSLAFWHEALALPLRGRGRVGDKHLDRIVGIGPTHIAWAEVSIPGGLLELFQYLEPLGEPVRPNPNDPGATHLCLEVNNIDRLSAHLQRLGYESRSARPVEIPTGDWQGWKDIYFTDPDGITVELSQRPSRSGSEAHPSVPSLTSAVTKARLRQWVGKRADVLPSQVDRSGRDVL